MNFCKLKQAAFMTLLVVTASSSASAGSLSRIRVDFNHSSPTAFAPLAAVFHDGSFNSFELGDNLSGTGLETLAEVGNPAGFLGSAPASANTGTNGMPTGQGVSSSFFIDVDSTNTSFNFASMVLFSNDWFIGNETNESIDVSSLLLGSIGGSINIDLDEVYDAGTETEDFTGVGGSGFFPFSTSGALGTDITNGTATLVDRSSNPFEDFTNLAGLDLAGFDPATLSAGFAAASLGTITLTRVAAVPEPSSAMLGVLLGGACLSRRRRK